MKDEQSFYNFLFTILFTALAAMGMYLLASGPGLHRSVSVFEFVLLSLATFRLIRLFTYDKALQWFRDFFVDVLVEDTGERQMVLRQAPERGVRRTLYELSTCPWCFGAWLALFVVFFYFYTPLAFYPVVVLAVAGIATLLQLLSNLIGHHAEYKKLATGRDFDK